MTKPDSGGSCASAGASIQAQTSVPSCLLPLSNTSIDPSNPLSFAVSFLLHSSWGVAPQ